MSFWQNKPRFARCQFNRPGSLFYQAFFGFWLTILGMFLMLLLLSQLHPEQLKSKQLHGKMLGSLSHLQRNIERLVNIKNKPVDTVLKHSRFTKNKWLYLSHPKIEQSLSSKANKHNMDLSLLYFDTPTPPLFIATDRYYAYGPLSITLNNEQYQLFQIKPLRDPPFVTRIKMLPFWLKALAILLPSIVLSILFSRRLVAPLSELGQAAKKLAQGELSTRVKAPKKRHDEIASLMHDFNFMAERLSNSVQAHKQLLADVSHELRSPLTRLTLANVMAQDTQGETQKNYLIRIEKEAKCLDKMLSDVLTLSRLEQNQQTLQVEAISLDGLISNLLSDAQFEAHQKGCTFISELPPSLLLKCDAALLNSAIENIIRNAIKYAHSTVTLTFKHTDTTISICVRDDGYGVSDEALMRLCQPFYRVSDSRNRSSGGIGLGLAITKRAVSAHNGKLILKHNTPNGLAAEIRLPL
ncbi:two-component system, OmpR family, sensor histidine kinase CpxA [Pseudoalteromonas citrea]|uniref:histidine kinase n=2 Tax=Pseudoalteromonas citrea TaxID=43655 RepID=A0AAD4AJI8_9GAMM|nr:ATP-binding protein [Pseudoalteromonas citrea]KAF7772040.1 two-component system, OmpR family, sensor histidine kinase CpxA [Pseudoalteromonas citrea]